MVIFVMSSPQFSMITQKIKIGEFFNYFSRSIQNIAHHSQFLFDGVISEGGGLKWEKATPFDLVGSKIGAKLNCSSNYGHLSLVQ